MRIRRWLAVSLLFWCLAPPAFAQVSAYEWVTQSGRNNLIDSNAESCDHGPFNPGTGIWASNGQGCYSASGALCSAQAGQICDLQVVPKGRCTYGSLSASGGPGGTNTCVWPHGAGRCSGNPEIGCVTNGYLANPANVASGPSFMCANAGGTCDMTTDPYGGPFRTDCACQGENAGPPGGPVPPNFETFVCGRGVCSDGDPNRSRGGYGVAVGFELHFGPGNTTFATLGPVVNGSAAPSTSPRFAIENPPLQVTPQRDAGTIERAETGPIHEVRTTDARELTPLYASLGVQKQRGFGDSFWSDWTFSTNTTTGNFDQVVTLLPCPVEAGWTPGALIDPTPGAPGSGDEGYCSELARDSLAIFWRRDLTPAEQAANPTCPPTCLKDFDLATTESEALLAVAGQDVNAAAQLAFQNAEGRAAGANDAVSFTPLTHVTAYAVTDLRCRLGGWGNPGGEVGRCSDSPTPCATPGVGPCPVPQQCRACNGPYHAVTNPTGLPIGYDEHGFGGELGLVAGQRIGIIDGVAIHAALPFLFVGTTGYATAEFRDLPGTLPGNLDLADLGPVDPGGPPLATGIGAGGTFTNGSSLPIGETCCASGASISWAPAQLGQVLATKTFLRTFDAGPGADGIPACTGDNDALTNGQNACDQRLGAGTPGAKTDPAFNTGLDDLAVQPIPAGVAASPARYSVNWSHGSPPGDLLPDFNQASAVALRDLDLFVNANHDLLVKANFSFCPFRSGSAQCGYFDESQFDPDLDGVPSPSDNCPTVFNPPQIDGDADGVGNACDNCVFFSNPRVNMALLTAGASANTNLVWATVTGEQRDDDHDGYGNKCDGDFVPTGLNVGTLDLAQFIASIGKSRLTDTCGTTGTRPCAQFDLDEGAALNIGTPDRSRMNALIGFPPGGSSPAGSGKCAVCPLPCAAGSAGNCF